MTQLGYFAPDRLTDALALLAEHGRDLTVLGGGTDLMPAVNTYRFRPKGLLFVGNLGLGEISEQDGHLLIGAAATWSQLEASEVAARLTPALVEAVKISSTGAVKNSATVAGNLATASPAADLALPLLTLATEVRLASQSGERWVALDDFFVGPGQTVMKPDELITTIRVSAATGPQVFMRLGGRRALTCAVVNVAVALEHEGKTCTAAKIALGAVAPTPIRCFAAEALLRGSLLLPDVVESCATEALAASQPIDDGRASAWYRKRAGHALVSRALVQAGGGWT